MGNPQAAAGSGEAGARRLRGVIFDMDGVLVDSRAFTVGAATRMFAEKGYEVGPEEFRPFFGMGEDRLIGGPAQARGIPLEIPGDKDRLYALYLDEIRGRLKPLAGAAEFVASCRARGLALAVASSADAVKVAGNLRELGLPPGTFAVVVDGSQVSRKKPAPDLFLEAARRLGLEPAACLVIEDAVAGVAAAVAAGSRCLALTTAYDPEQLAAADWIAPDLAHVPPAALDW